MVENAVKLAGIGEEWAAIHKRHAALAEDVRVEALGGKEKLPEIDKVIAEIKKAQKNKVLEKVSIFSTLGVSKQKSIFVSLGGMRAYLYFNGVGDTAEAKYCSPVPCEISFPAEHKFTEEFLSLESCSEALVKKSEGLRAQVAATLNQFTTVEKLLDSWPEAKELLPKEKAVKTALPAVRVKDLNCLIGLPS